MLHASIKQHVLMWLERKGLAKHRFYDGYTLKQEISNLDLGQIAFANT